MPTHRIWIVVLCISCSIPLRGASLGNGGGTIFTGGTTAVQLKKMAVTVDLHHDSSAVTARFLLYNPTNGRVRIPLYSICDENDPIVSNEPIRNFKCLVNDSAVKYGIVENEHVNTKPGTHLEASASRFFFWNVDIGPKDTVWITTAYTGTWGTSNYGIDGVAFTLGHRYCTWAEPVAEGAVVFNHTHLASGMFINREYSTASSDRLQAAFFDDSTVFSFYNYGIEKRRIIELRFIAFWDKRHEANVYTFKHVDALGFLTPEQNYRMKNEIYARHGYIFKDKTLSEYFSAKRWYTPDHRFSANVLNKYELFLINAFKKNEKKGG